MEMTPIAKCVRDDSVNLSVDKKPTEAPRNKGISENLGYSFKFNKSIFLSSSTPRRIAISASKELKITSHRNSPSGRRATGHSY